MGLRDHFHPPLSVWRPWHSVHHSWCTAISAELNERLPKRYIAMPNVQYNIEIDVATFEEDRVTAADAKRAEGGSVATAISAAWAPPVPAQSLRFPLVTDAVETLVYKEEGGLTLVAAIELVSPANKDRPEHRQAFTSKCETYLQQGAGVVIVDIVTDRHANLHDELLERLDDPDTVRLGAPNYATSYHTVERGKEPRLDIWQTILELQKPLPKMPLWLKGGLCLPVDFEMTYEQTCRALRIDAAQT